MPYNTVMFNVPAILKKLDIKSGSIVADLGTGREGRMALASAKMIGDDGIAYAVDIVKAILPAVQTKAAIYGLHTVRTVWSNLEIYGATKVISDNSLDVAFLVTILFQSKKQEDIMKEAKRMLKPGGRLCVVDWKANMPNLLGPAQGQRVNPETIKKLGQNLKLKLKEEFDAGQCHWGLIFIK